MFFVDKFQVKKRKAIGISYKQTGKRSSHNPDRVNVEHRRYR